MRTMPAAPITKLIGLMLILNFYYYALQPTTSSDRHLVQKPVNHFFNRSRKLHFPHSRIHISIGDLPAVR